MTEGIVAERGLAQGYPVSPTVFAAMLDELWAALEDKFQGWRDAGVRMDPGDKAMGLAWADDLYLWAGSRDTLEEMVQWAAEWVRRKWGL